MDKLTALNHNFIDHKHVEIQLKRETRQIEERVMDAVSLTSLKCIPWKDQLNKNIVVDLTNLNKLPFLKMIIKSKVFVPTHKLEIRFLIKDRRKLAHLPVFLNYTCEQLIMKNKNSGNKCINSKLMKSLSTIPQMQLETVCFERYFMTWKVFYKLLTLFRRINRIQFFHCVITTDEHADLSQALSGLTTQALSLSYWNLEYNPLSEDISACLFENMIKSLATSDDLKKNLLKISLSWIMIDHEEAKKLIKQSGLEHIDISF
jgi:hypothetical protein